MLRVSNMLMSSNMRNYIQNNLQKSAKSQEQISTGKTINRPSDNPSEISHLMAVNATLISNEQYAKNIQDGLAYLNQSDSVLDTIGKTLQDVKVLAAEGANGTMTKEDMNAVAEQIDKQLDALKDLGNSALGGKYLFAGRKNGQPPFERINDEIYYRGDTNQITREIAFGFSYEVVAAGVSNSGEPGVFGVLSTGDTIEDPKNPVGQMIKVTGGPLEVLKNLRDNLKNGDAASIQQSLEDIDSAHDDVLKHRVGVGARTRHLEAVKDQLDDQEVKLKGVLVDIQGADIAELTIEVAQNQLVYQASLMTAAKLLDTNLMQYLR